MSLLQNDGQLFRPVRPYPELVRPLREVTREHIERALILCEGNRSLAANRLGISLVTLRRYVKRFLEEN